MMLPRRTGRTTRMLQYALHRIRNRMTTTVVAKDRNHAKGLELMFETLRSDRDKQNAERYGRIGIISLSDMFPVRQSPKSLGDYNYETNRLKSIEPEIEVLFDHFAMECHLDKIIAYLDAASYVSNYDTWLLETARMLSVTKRVGLVVAPDHVLYFSEKLEGCDVEIMSDSDNVDYVGLDFKPNINAKHQLLFHPEYLRHLFEGALSTITRFDE